MKRKMFRFFLVVAISWFASSTALAQAQSSSNLNLGLNEAVNSLYPPEAYGFADLKLMHLIYQGLVGYDEHLKLTPSLAKSWEIQEGGKRLVFHLRSDVFFHDNVCFPDGQGRAVKASDFKYCFERICTPAPDNESSWLLTDFVVGAQAFFEAKAANDPSIDSIKGLKIPNDTTLIFSLLKPDADFVYRLGMPALSVYPEEAVLQYGKTKHLNPVGTGPFVLTEIQPRKTIQLVKNNRYWEFNASGQRLPYLAQVNLHIFKDKFDQIEALQQNQLDAIIPTYDMAGSLLKDNSLTPKQASYQLNLRTAPRAWTSYYSFSAIDSTLDAVDFRRAINYAIDREKLLQEVFNGNGQPATHGLIPAATADYSNASIEGFEFSSIKAKKHLELAGYQEGSTLPTLKVNINNKRDNVNLRVAESIQKMLMENLGLQVEIEVLPFQHHLETVELGEASIWRDGWMADYSTALNYLNLFYGKEIPEDPRYPSQTNTCRFQDSAFDLLFEKASRTIAPMERLPLLIEAEQLLIDEAVIIPLWYHYSYVITSKKVKNIVAHGQNVYDLTRVSLQN